MQPRIKGMDQVSGAQLAFGLVFGLNPVADGRRNICFWGGWGGYIAIIDQDNELSFSYVMNKMADGLLGDDRGNQPASALFSSLPR